MKISIQLLEVFINCDYFGKNVKSLLGPSVSEVISWYHNLQCHIVQKVSLYYEDTVDCTLLSEVSKDWK